MPLRPDSHELNRLSWNAVTPAHNRHGGDQTAFFRQGGSTLYPEELRLLGELRGRTVAHLQCNCGQDTLSLARQGARVTGVDISDRAIEFARDLSAASGVPATFHRSDLIAWLTATEERFDVAFASYGVLCWMSDLDAYFRGVARILRPGGRYVLVEFHPVAFMYDETWNLAYPYSSREPLLNQEGVGDYVRDCPNAVQHGDTPTASAAREFKNPFPSHEFAWGLGDVVTALLTAGLELRHLAEYPYMNGWKGFDRMEALPGGRWRAPGDMPELPLMYSVAALRPGQVGQE